MKPQQPTLRRPCGERHWEACQGPLRQNSVVVFHDSEWVEGVQPVIPEHVAPRVRHSGSLPNMWWGWVK